MDLPRGRFLDPHRKGPGRHVEHSERGGADEAERTLDLLCGLERKIGDFFKFSDN